MTGERRNLAASVSDRLRARGRGEDYQALLTRYALERFLYRLSVSEQRDRFVLKGAMLFAAWTGLPQRPTRDLDLLGYGDASTDEVVRSVRAICATPVDPDGLLFDANTIVAVPMKEDEDYAGVRLALNARLGSARVRVLVDVGFGDAVTPGPEELLYPVLLDFPAPRLRAYPRETVIAEKFEAMVRLGRANSRMKDFYDIWLLSQTFAFDGSALSRAMAATFARRRTALPDGAPFALTQDFSTDANKHAQWRAFRNRGHLIADTPELANLVEALHNFLVPPLDWGSTGEVEHRWPPAGPWRTQPFNPGRAQPIPQHDVEESN